MSSEWSSAILLIILFCSVFCGIVSWWPCVLLLLVLCGTGLCNATGCLVQIIYTAVFLACFVLLAVFFSVPLFFPHRRPYVGIFFLVVVLFRPCSSCLFLFNTYVVLAAFFTFLHHIIQNSCRFLFSALCWYLLPRLRVVWLVQQLSAPF